MGEKSFGGFLVGRSRYLRLNLQFWQRVSTFVGLSFLEFLYYLLFPNCHLQKPLQNSIGWIKSQLVGLPNRLLKILVCLYFFESSYSYPCPSYSCMLLFIYTCLGLFSLNCHVHLGNLGVLFCPSVVQHWGVYTLWLWLTGPCGSGVIGVSTLVKNRVGHLLSPGHPEVACRAPTLVRIDPSSLSWGSTVPLSGVWLLVILGFNIGL